MVEHPLDSQRPVATPQRAVTHPPDAALRGALGAAASQLSMVIHIPFDGYPRVRIGLQAAEFANGNLPTPLDGVASNPCNGLARGSK